MPARRCPDCGLVNPGSATHCDCGYPFDGGTRREALALTKQTACPMCGEPAPSRPCECGYAFDDDPSDLRDVLAHRIAVGWVMIAGGVLSIAAFVLLLFVQIVSESSRLYLVWGLFAGGLALVVKGCRVVSAARAPLRRLAAKERALPQAKVVR
jgi:hypothetical protein